MRLLRSSLAFGCLLVAVSSGCSSSTSGKASSSGSGATTGSASGSPASGASSGAATNASSSGTAASNSSSGSSGTASGEIQLKGAAAKGPFVIQSAVTVSPIDAQGNPSGQSFNTNTTDNQGDFSVAFAYQGPVQLNAQGYFYDEIGGAVSSSTLALNGVANVTASGSQNAFINTITHLEYARVKTLMQGGSTFAAALAQADTELFGALSVAGPGFNPGVTGSQMNVLGASNAANAYLLAIGSVFAESAYLDLTAHGGTGSVDGYLTTLLNTASTDFSAGTIDSATLALLAQAQGTVEPDAVTGSMQTYFDGGVTVPNINLALDTDGDGVVNATDTCVLQANPTQTTIPPGLCAFRRQHLAESSGAGINLALAANITGAGIHDLVYVSSTIQVFLGADGGAPSAPITTSLDAVLGTVVPPTQLVASVTDINGDGFGDLLIAYFLPQLPDSGASYSQNETLAFLPGDGQGHFAQAVELLAIPVQSSFGGSGGCQGTGQAACPMGNGITCIDVSSDNTNCGGCNLLCPTGSTCQDSACTVAGGGTVPATSTLGIGSSLGVATNTDGTREVVAIPDSSPSVSPETLLVVHALFTDGGLGPQVLVTANNQLVNYCVNDCPSTCTPAADDAGYCPANCVSSCIPTPEGGYCPQVPGFDGGGHGQTFYCPSSCVPADAGTCPDFDAGLGRGSQQCPATCTPYDSSTDYCANDCPGATSGCIPLPDAGPLGFCASDCPASTVTWCTPTTAESCPYYDGGNPGPGQQQCPASCEAFSGTPNCPSDCPAAGGTCTLLPDAGPGGYCPNSCSSCPAFSEGVAFPNGPGCSPGCDSESATDGGFDMYCGPRPGCPANCTSTQGITFCQEGCGATSGPSGPGCQTGCYCPADCDWGTCTPTPDYCSFGQSGSCACPPGCPTTCVSSSEPVCNNNSCGTNSPPGSCQDPCTCPADCPSPTTCAPSPTICAQGCGTSGQPGTQECSTGCSCPADCPSPATCTQFPGYCSNPGQTGSCVCPADCPSSCLPVGTPECNPTQGGGGGGQACICEPGCPSSCNSLPQEGYCTSTSQPGQCACAPGCPTSCTTAPSGTCPTGCSASCFEPSFNSSGPPTNALAVGDVNGDGLADVAVSVGASAQGNQGGGTPAIAGGLWVLLADASGGFTASEVGGVTAPVGGVALVDFDGDGNLDVAAFDECGAIAGTTGSYVVYVLYGDGQGTFSGLVTVNVPIASGGGHGSGPSGGQCPTGSPGAPPSFAAADIDGDGKADLLVGGSVLGSQGRTFGAPVVIPNFGEGFGASAIVPTPDFDESGHADYVDPQGQLILSNPPGYQSW